MLARNGKRRQERDRVDDERRLTELFSNYADRVLTYLRHRTDQDTAQEVLTETFLVVWRKLDQVPEEPCGWLFAVAKRVLANQVRSQGRTAALIERVAAESRMAVVGCELQDAMARLDVLTALAALPERDREVLLLAGWYELPGPQAAQALGCSQTAYAVRLHRARRRLRAALADATDPSAVADRTTVRPAWEAQQ